jgi:N-carbamoylputrescine amidase
MNNAGLTIGLAAAQFINNDVRSNLAVIVRNLDDAKKQNVDMLLFGEAFLQGFASLTWNPDTDLFVGIELKSEPLELLRDHCRKTHIALGIGYIEREQKELYSSYLIIDKYGNDIMNYRRISKGWRAHSCDTTVYREGTEFETTEYMGYTITAGLCGDFWTDEVIRKLPKNSDLVLWPVFVDYDKEAWENAAFNEYTAKAKSIANNIVFVNALCSERKSLAYGGAFAVLNGNVVAVLEQGKEEILVIPIENYTSVW